MLRRIVRVLAVALVGAPGLLSAQYFGRNKVQYTDFDFKIIQTEHFDVYYYDRERTAALDAARIAERSYARLSKVLNHEFRERKPIILYASHSDFMQTNATEVSGEGTGGVTDFARNRAVMPFTGAYSDFEHVLTHEMAHQFQYDIWSRGRAGAGINTLIAIAPPLWFAEGMAEYLSLGPINAETAMWLRDASLEGKLPTIEQMTADPYEYFPYRFGHALWSYIGERWGDEAVGAILKATLSGGVEPAFRRTIGLSLEQLSEQWRDAVQKRYLPEIGARAKAKAVADELLNKKRSEGTLHLAPALSPDGSQVAYFSEKDFYFVDLYLANGQTGKVKRRILKSGVSSNYETYRFINSQANWSPDGKYLAFAAKRGPKDDIVIVDVARNKQVGRIQLKLSGVTTPAWSPDGKQLVFTGYDGGISDLFVVNRDGSNLQRLTSDKYGDLHPVWSPDGKTIAFATDRGPATDFKLLKYSNFRIALYDVATGQVKVLDHMESGKNVSPQWAPDGRSIAFVSDRSGVSNIYLYDLNEGQIYQLTDFYTGVQGITPLSPVLSWATQADRLAFVYYEDQKYDVYTLNNPRALKRSPYVQPPVDSVGILARVATPPLDTTRSLQVREEVRAQVGEGGSIYRTQQGFRSSGDLGRSGSDTTQLSKPVSISALMDSANYSLPDTSEFTLKDYRVHFSPDYIARPSIGYARDNFGRGFFGGSAISLSDILGNHQLVFAGYVNGRIAEAQVLAAYANLSKRVNWAVGLSQDPYYFLEPSEIVPDPDSPGNNIFVTNIRRLVVRSVFSQAYYPLSRFQRLEASMRFANVDDALLQINEPYNPTSGFATADPFLETLDLQSVNYAQPSMALVFDNSLTGYVGPFYGRRYRLEAAQTLGDWKFSQVTADYRRYDGLIGPIVLATRVLYFGRIGRDAAEFTVFAGSTDLIRGNTSGSYRRNECLNANDTNTETGCAALDRLVGTQIGVGSVEIRFPILNPSFGIPAAIPPLEGALFYDIGLAWDDRTTIKWSREAGDDPTRVRTPLQTFGASLRANLFGFAVARLDYSIPQERRAVKGLWTFSLGPTF
jgi:Tol biopolymer transport system component